MKTKAETLHTKPLVMRLGTADVIGNLFCPDTTDRGTLILKLRSQLPSWISVIMDHSVQYLAYSFTMGRTTRL